MVSDRDSKFDKPRPFVEVTTIDGKSRRFAAGTKAGFALERINNSRVQETTEGVTRRFSHIESVKEGEGSVEFGPDAELVSYGEGWQLRAVQESEATCARSLQTGASKPDTKEEIKAINRAQRKEFNPADFYPGGRVPDSGPPEDNFTYFRNVVILVVALISFGAMWVYLLENQFFIGARV